jgi:hypothetical protein
MTVQKISDLFTVQGYGVVVTGGASGLGLGFTEALAGNGARVTVLDIDPRRIEEETRRLQKQGLDVRGAVVDVCDHPALDKAIDAPAIPPGPWRPTPTSAGTRSSISISTVSSPPRGPPHATCGRENPGGSSSPRRWRP